MPTWTMELVAGVFAAAAMAGCAAQPSATPEVARGRTTIVVPRVVGLDLANAVAELDYLRMIPALVDRARRPMFAGAGGQAGGQAGCRVIRQRPRARTEVVEGELTVTVTITVSC